MSVTLMLGGTSDGYSATIAALYEQGAIFCAEIDGAAAILDPLLAIPARSLLLTEVHQNDPVSRSRLDQISTFVLQHAAARQLLADGLRIEAMVAYSVGEYVAACLAGVFAPERILALMAARAASKDALPLGAMLAVPLTEAECLRLLRPGLWLAAVEGPKLCVLSGHLQTVRDCELELRRRDITVMRLPAAHAYHSPLVSAAEPRLRALHERVPMQPPAVRFVSSVTGRWITDAEATSADYWSTRPGRTIRFADGIRTVSSDPSRFYVDLSDRAALSSLLLNCAGQQVGLRARMAALTPRKGLAPGERRFEAIAERRRKARRGASDRLTSGPDAPRRRPESPLP